jgi:hypothetical protein
MSFHKPLAAAVLLLALAASAVAAQQTTAASVAGGATLATPATPQPAVAATPAAPQPATTPPAKAPRWRLTPRPALSPANQTAPQQAPAAQQPAPAAEQPPAAAPQPQPQPQVAKPQPRAPAPEAPAAPAPSACDLSPSPTKCRTCAGRARTGRAAMLMTAPLAIKELAEPACGACGSLPTPALQEFCTACVADYGPDNGCAACVGKMNLALVAGEKPAADAVEQAARCLGCYNTVKPNLKVRPYARAAARVQSRSAFDWAQTQSAAASRPVIQQHGSLTQLLHPSQLPNPHPPHPTPTPNQGTYACVPCWLGSAAKESAACSSCVAAAATEQQAGICTVCNARDALATGKQCYECMAQAPVWPAKALCGLTAAPKQDAKAARAFLPEYFGCLAAAKTEEAAQLCAGCMGVADKAGKARKCFVCLEGLATQNLNAGDLAVRGSLCAL